MIANASVPVVTHARSVARSIRPIAAAAIHGIAFDGDRLYALDATNGYLLEIDPRTDSTRILNRESWQDFIGATGLAIADGTLWFTRYEDVYFCPLAEPFQPQRFLSLAYPVDGIAVWEATIYLTSQRLGAIAAFSRETRREITRFYAPGIGVENIAVRDEQLWLSDNLEQTVFCLDRATGAIEFSVLTPFENPTGLAFQPNPDGDDLLYVAYVHDEPYIRDNPNSHPNHELAYRDRTFLHPLYYHYHRAGNYALSNGYRVEMSYVEELAPLDNLELTEIEWCIALPAETPRQQTIAVEPVGIPFEERIIDGQRVACFRFDRLHSGERCLFGWKAILHVWSIKYQFGPKDGDDLPELPPEFREHYLVDNDNLAMDKENIQRAASEAAGSETNLLRKMYSIRNYVYDRLAYGIKPHIDTPDVALARGVGSCGEYLGVLLALSRLNGIACRTVGRYKCPPKQLQRHLPLEPDYNHVWMEFYLPGFGWLPLESNTDDTIEGGPYPTRFFMGLSWYHAEMGKGIPFEKLYRDGVPLPREQVSIGELAINHVSFTILDELRPGPPS